MSNEGHEKFQKQFQVFVGQVTELMKEVWSESGLMPLWKEVAQKANEAVKSDKVVTDKGNAEVVNCLFGELKFYDDFFKSIKEVAKIKCFNAAEIILESISKLFHGSILGKFADIMQELLKLTVCLHLEKAN